MKNFRVAFFDIDGTLADNQLPQALTFTQRVPDSAKRALKKLKANNIEPVIASGRHHQTIVQLAKDLGVDSVISSNGNCVHYRGKMLHQNIIPPDLVVELVDYLRKQQIDFLLETEQCLYCFENSHYYLNHSTEKTILKMSDPFPDGILQLIIPWNEKNILKFEPSSPLIVEKVAPMAATIHLKNGTKAAGFPRICEEMAITPHQALAFGDEENDFTMFDAVGFPVAMGNASPELKEKAAHVTTAVSDDGIWNACITLGLITE